MGSKKPMVFSPVQVELSIFTSMPRHSSGTECLRGFEKMLTSVHSAVSSSFSAFSAMAHSRRFFSMSQESLYALWISPA